MTYPMNNWGAPEPPPAHRHQRKYNWWIMGIGALFVAFMILGAIGAANKVKSVEVKPTLPVEAVDTTDVLATTAGAPVVESSPPTTTKRVVTTTTHAPVVTMPKLDSIQTWATEYNYQITSFLDQMVSVANNLGSAVDSSVLMEGCSGATQIINATAFADVSNDPNTPVEWKLMLSSYRQGFSFCAIGDFNSGTTYINEAVGHVNELTALVKAHTP
jgi:hypothetical protein